MEPVVQGDEEHDAFAHRRGERLASGLVGLSAWLELEIESAPEHPARCVALHAPHGIGTPELRFPLASIVVEPP